MPTCCADECSGTRRHRGDGTLALSWDAPRNADAGITGYSYQCTTVNGTWSQGGSNEFFSANTGSTSQVQLALQGGANGVSGAGYGPWSDVATGSSD